MKRSILTVILIFCSFFYAFGQNSDTIDLLLLLDTSSSMSSSYEKVNDYITGSFLSEFLRVGDTFHLISFSANPRLDIARKISARGDVETIIGRMLIQYPVETGNDVKAAVNYAEAYISTLPPRPKKIIMVSSGGTDTNNIISAAKQRFSSKNATIDFVSVTNGQNLANLPSSGRSPAKSQQGSSSLTASGTAPTGTSAKPSDASSSTSTQGTTAQGSSQTGTQKTTQGTSAQGTTAQGSSQTGTQKTTQGTSTQGTTAQGSSQTGAQTTAQGTTAQGTSQTGTQKTTQGTSTQGTTAQGSSQTGTQTTAQGTTAQGSSQTGAQSTTPASSSETLSAGSSAQGVSSSGDGQSSDKNRDSQQTSTVKGSSDTGDTDAAKQKNSGSVNPTLLLIIGIIAALLLLFLLIRFISRRLVSSPNRLMATASASGREKEDRLTDHSKDLANYAARQSSKRVTPYSDRPLKEQVVKQPVINPTSPILINLFVEDQNTSIGKRNIHSLKSGYSLSVGGGKADDFHIFLVQMPPRLGEIRRNGSQLTFIPRKPKHFPDIGSNEIKDCINKRIRVISDKNYEMWFSFVMYEDPLEALNRVLHSIKVPG